MLPKSLLQGLLLFSQYHFGHTRHFFNLSSVTSMFTVSTSSCGFLHLTELKDGEMVLSRPLECFSCLLDLLFLIIHLIQHNIRKLTFIVWEYTVTLGVITYNGSIIMLLKCDHFIPAVGWLGLIFKVTLSHRGLRKSVNSIEHNFTGIVTTGRHTHTHTHVEHRCGVEVHSVSLVFKLSPCCSNDISSSGYFPGVLSIKSRRFGTLCRFHLHRVVNSAFNAQTPGKYPEGYFSCSYYFSTKRKMNSSNQSIM
jgi:hypothetical protein